MILRQILRLNKLPFSHLTASMIYVSVQHQDLFHAIKSNYVLITINLAAQRLVRVMIGEAEEQHCKSEGQPHHGEQDFLCDRNKVPHQPPSVPPDIGHLSLH